MRNETFLRYLGSIVAIIGCCLIAWYLLKKYLVRREDNLEILIGNSQSIGDRKKQEDSFSTIRNENGTLAILADGMGGLLSGKVASNLTVQTFLEQFSRTYHIESINKFLINTTYMSNKKVLKKAEGRKVGTTLATALVTDNLFYWVAVGDSHIYLYRDREVIQLNQDHIYANRLKKAYQDGEVSRYEVFNHPKRDRLTSYIGHEEFHQIDYSKNPVELETGDKIILCSDGVYDCMDKIELENILDSRKPPMEVSERILDKVLKKNINNQDNATVVVLEKS